MNANQVPLGFSKIVKPPLKDSKKPEFLLFIVAKLFSCRFLFPNVDLISHNLNGEIVSSVLPFFLNFQQIAGHQ